MLRSGAQKRIKLKLKEWKGLKEAGLVECTDVLEKLQGWMAYAVKGNTYYLRKKIMTKFNKHFSLDK